jgi:hypothetical protein
MEPTKKIEKRKKRTPSFRLITFRVLLKGVLIPGGLVALVIYAIYRVLGDAGENAAGVLGVYVGGPLVFVASLYLFLRGMPRSQKKAEGDTTDKNVTTSTNLNA